MKRSGLLILFMLSVYSLWGQTLDTEYYPGWEWSGPHETITDDHIFYSPAWESADPFRDLSRYRFWAVRYRERGLDDRRRKVYLEGVDLSDNISSYPDYTLISLLRKTPFTCIYSPAMVAGGGTAGNIGYSESYFAGSAGTGRGIYAALRTADRSYRLSFDANGRFPLGREWDGTMTVTGKYGSDGHVRGVGTNEAGGMLSLRKDFGKERMLSFAAAGTASQSGFRMASVSEAFDLTGDEMYNPSWGYQDGRVRNSRLRNTASAFVSARFETPLGNGRNLTATAAFHLNRYGRTGLAWYGAHSPMPDYYRVMPSYFPGWSATGIIAEAWRQNDPTVTQVDWDRLIRDNMLEESGHAIYMLEERVELSQSLDLNLHVDRRMDGGLGISYGLRVRSDRSRNYKKASDLLGADYVLNIDQYVTDDEEGYYPGLPNDNDLRDPGRRVREGDRFGYDYAVARLVPSLFGMVRWNRVRYGLTASASLTHTGLKRNGFYEKELFPGGESFGRSAASRFTTYSFGASAYWNVSVKQRLSLSVLASSEAPFARDIFISPEQNNHIAANAVPPGVYGAELSWSLSGRQADLRITGFLNSTTGETAIHSYYDDLASLFSNMIVRGVDKLCFGVEAGAEVRLTRTLSLKAGGSAGIYRYNSEPVAEVRADADNSVISEGVVCYMSGLRPGAPQVVAAAELTCSTFSRWRVSLSGEYAGKRYVEINPLYHSSRVTGINAAPEIMELFTSQERLPDAFTLGLSLSKGFALKNGYLRFAASARNLLSSRIIHSGYEQMRIMRSGSGVNRTLVPFPSKYLYSYPLTWNLTVSYSL